MDEELWRGQNSPSDYARQRWVLRLDSNKDTFQIERGREFKTVGRKKEKEYLSAECDVWHRDKGNTSRPNKKGSRTEP